MAYSQVSALGRQDILETRVMKQGDCKGMRSRRSEYEGERRRYLGSRGRLDRA